MNRGWFLAFAAIIIVLAIPTVLLYVLNNGNPYTEFIVNQHVPNYLKEKEMTQDRIKKSLYVEPKYLINRDFHHGHYMIIFKDEPDITYYYGLTKKGKQVKQFCEKDKESSDGTNIIENRTKHSEKKCVRMFDHRDE